jgi:hypothetical protein
MNCKLPEVVFTFHITIWVKLSITISSTLLINKKGKGKLNQYWMQILWSKFPINQKYEHPKEWLEGLNSNSVAEVSQSRHRHLTSLKSTLAWIIPVALAFWMMLDNSLKPLQEIYWVETILYTLNTCKLQMDLTFSFLPILGIWPSHYHPFPHLPINSIPTFITFRSLSWAWRICRTLSIILGMQ